VEWYGFSRAESIESMLMRERSERRGRAWLSAVPKQFANSRTVSDANGHACIRVQLPAAPYLKTTAYAAPGSAALYGNADGCDFFRILFSRAERS